MSPQLTFSVSNYWPSQTNNVRPSPSSHQGRTIKKVMEGKGERPGCGGGAGRLQVQKKKVFVHGFVNEKNYARRRALKIYVSALAVKNILARDISTEKKIHTTRKFLTPSPQLFSSGRSLCWVIKNLTHRGPPFLS